MLVSNPRKQKLFIQVKDALGFADLTIGTGEVCIMHNIICIFVMIFLGIDHKLFNIIEGKLVDSLYFMPLELTSPMLGTLNILLYEK